MNKIIKIDNLEAVSKKLKKEKKKIVLCHGVFDLLHIGHLNYFKSSKIKGDTLVVSVTPGKFVNKGINRPYNTDKDRIDFLSSIEIIDHIVLNTTATAVNVIEKLKPDYYSKGPDYKNLDKDITGEIKNEIKALKSVKGKIIFTNDRTLSSSKILNSYDNTLNDDQKKFLNFFKTKFDISYINHYLEKIKSLKVTVIGEIILDKYIFCETIGKSGKEPHLVLKELENEKYLGGVGAIANNTALFCESLKLISYTGKNESQIKFIKQKLSKKIKKNFIEKKNSPTIEKKRFIDHISKSKILGVYNLNDQNLDISEEKKLDKLIKSNLNKSDLVITSDYGHGLISPKIAKLISSKKVYFALNAQLNAFNIGYHSLAKYNNINFLIINESELRHEIRDKLSSVEVLIDKLNKVLKIDNLVITQGKKGAVFYNKKNKAKIYCPAFANNVVDKVGAGDAMLSIMSLLCKAGCHPMVSLFLGSLAAAQNVEKLNNSAPLSKSKLIQYANYMIK